MDNAPTPPTESITDKSLSTASETEAVRPRRRPKPFYASTSGARKGRMEKIEDLMHSLIKLGLVKVIRRKFAPPLIQWTPQEPKAE